MRGSRRHLAIIDRRRSTVLQTNHHEPAAAKIAGGRMCHCERKRNCDGSVDSVAAAPHDLNPDTRSELVRGRNDSVFGAHRFARHHHVAQQREHQQDWSNSAKGRSTGRVYVHSGANGKRLLTLTGETAGEGFGTTAAVAGDVDRDGYADLVVGSWQYSDAVSSGGRVYLYSGKTGRLLTNGLVQKNPLFLVVPL